MIPQWEAGEVLASQGLRWGLETGDPGVGLQIQNVKVPFVAVKSFSTYPAFFSLTPRLQPAGAGKPQPGPSSAGYSL